MNRVRFFNIWMIAAWGIWLTLIPGAWATVIVPSNESESAVQSTASQGGPFEVVQTVLIAADPGKLFADGSSKSLISAFAVEDTGDPVIKGTPFEFTTTLGKFQNGGTTLEVFSEDDSGIVSVYLVSGLVTGDAIVTCTVGGVSKAVLIPIYSVQYETETNNFMDEADAMCLDVAFNGQLASPYDEDWYGLSIKANTRIFVNFVTTAIPEGAGCDGSSTVGTYRIDLRDAANNVLMSHQNVDCTFDNGFWETGVLYSGNYYLVVFCPRLPDNGHYLSTPYYLTASTSPYPLCGDFNQDGTVDFKDITARYQSSRQGFSSWLRNCWMADRQYIQGDIKGAFLQRAFEPSVPDNEWYQPSSE